MDKEWIIGADGKNLKFKRETLLNYAMNRWGLNKAQSVGPTSELIRACAPKTTMIGNNFILIQPYKRRKTEVESHMNIFRV